MIYVTGDIHGDIERFGEKALKQLKKRDTLIICGDFGFVWDGSKGEAAALKKLSKKRFTILFVEGSHDNLAKLAQYPEEEWQGGRVRRIAPNIMQLMRGYIFNIEDKSIFAFGGAKSQEIDSNPLSDEWWELEMPTMEEKKRGKTNLALRGNQVDYIITHDCASRLKALFVKDVDGLMVKISPLLAVTIDDLNDYLEEISQTVQFKKWFFGCYHQDKPLGKNITTVYKEVHPLV